MREEPEFWFFTEQCISCPLLNGQLYNDVITTLMPTELVRGHHSGPSICASARPMVEEMEAHPVQ